MYNTLHLIIDQNALATAEDSCVDSTEKFFVSGLQKMKSCRYVRLSFTFLCHFSDVKDACPVSCDTCYRRHRSCIDSNRKFYVADSFRPNSKRTCSWASNKSSKRCGFENVSDMCPVTCNVCDPDWFVFQSPYIYSTTNELGFNGQYQDGVYIVGRNSMESGWDSPPMTDVVLNDSSTLYLSLSYSLSGTNPCPSTALYLRLRLAYHRFGYANPAIATTELVGPFTDTDKTYSKVFTIADDIVNKAKDDYTYYVDTVVVEGDPFCTGTYRRVKFDVETNFAYYDKDYKE